MAETEVEIPMVEPDWAVTLNKDGPSVMMQKLCGFRLSHAEKTPDDPAERCARDPRPCLFAHLTDAALRAGLQWAPSA